MKPMLTNPPLKEGQIKEEELKEHNKTEDQAEECEDREDDGGYCGEKKEDDYEEVDYGEECLIKLQKKEELDTVATGNMDRSTQLLQETDNVRNSYVQDFPTVQPEVRACGINSHVYTHHALQQYPVQPYVRAWRINSNDNLHHYPPQQYPMQPYVTAQGIHSQGNLHQYGQNEADAYQYMSNMESQLTQQLYGRDHVRNSYVQFFPPVQPDVRTWGINPHVYTHAPQQYPVQPYVRGWRINSNVNLHHYPPQQYPMQPYVTAQGMNSNVNLHHNPPQQYPMQPYVTAQGMNSNVNLHHYPPQQYPMQPYVTAQGIHSQGNLHQYGQNEADAYQYMSNMESQLTQQLYGRDHVRNSYVQFFPPVQPDVRTWGINPHVYTHAPQQYPVQPYVRGWRINSNVNLHHYPPQQYPMQPYVTAQGMNSNVNLHHNPPQQYPMQPYVTAQGMNSNVNLHHYPPQQYPMQPYVTAQGIHSQGNLHQYGQNEADAYQYMSNMESQLTQQLYGRDHVRNSYVQFFPPVQPDVRTWGINPHVYTHAPQQYPVQPYVRGWRINSNVNLHHYPPQQYPMQPYVTAQGMNSNVNLHHNPPQQYPMQPYVTAQGMNSQGNLHQYGQNEADAYQYMSNMESQLTQQLYGRDHVRNSYVQFFPPVQPDVRAWGINPHVYTHAPQQYPVQPYVRGWRMNSNVNLYHYPPQQYPMQPYVLAWDFINSHITHPLSARLYGNLQHNPQWWYAKTEGRESSHVPYFTPELPANRRLPIKTPPELKYVVEIKKKRQEQDEEDLYDLPNVLSSSAVEMSMEQYRVPRRYHHSRRTLDKVKKVLTFSDSE